MALDLIDLFAGASGTSLVGHTPNVGVTPWSSATAYMYPGSNVQFDGSGFCFNAVTAPGSSLLIWPGTLASGTIHQIRATVKLLSALSLADASFPLFMNSAATNDCRFALKTDGAGSHFDMTDGAGATPNSPQAFTFPASGTEWEIRLTVNTGASPATCLAEYSTDGGQTWSTIFGGAQPLTNPHGDPFAPGVWFDSLSTQTTGANGITIGNFRVGTPNANPTLSVSPTTFPAGTPGTLTLTGVGTNWTSGTPGSPTFTVSGGTGAGLSSQVISSVDGATVTLNPGSAAGTLTITDPSGGTATVTVSAGATSATFTGPASGAQSVASTNFTLTLNGVAPSGGQAFALSDSSAGGTFTPSTLTIASGQTVGTFTYTPAGTGNRTLTPTSSGIAITPTTKTYLSTGTATVSGPTGGGVGIPSTNFTVTLGVAAPSTGTVVALSDGGAGGTFTPSSLTVASGQTVGTLTYTPATTGAVTLTPTSSGITFTPSTLTYTATAGTATAFTLTAPSPANGFEHDPSGNFTFTPTGGTYTGTITPTMSGLAGSWTPTTLSWTASATAKTATFTPAATGTGTANGTSSPSLTQPSSVSYTSNAQTLAVSPSSIPSSAVTTVTFLGGGTNWLTTPPTFSTSGVAGVAAGSVTVVSNTSCTAPVTTGTASGTVTYTDSTDSATATQTVSASPGTAQYFSTIDGVPSGATLTFTVHDLAGNPVSFTGGSPVSQGSGAYSATFTALSGTSYVGVWVVNGGAPLLDPAVLVGSAGPGGVYPSVNDVRAGVQYGDGGTALTGTVSVPSVSQVRAGITFDANGSLTGTYAPGQAAASYIQLGWNTLPDSSEPYTVVLLFDGNVSASGNVNLPARAGITWNSGVDGAAATIPIAVGANYATFTVAFDTGSYTTIPLTHGGLGFIGGDPTMPSAIASPGSGSGPTAGQIVASLLSTIIPNANPPGSVADCFNAARAQGFGRWGIAGSNLNLYGPDGQTIVRTFILDNPDDARSRV